MIQTFFPISFRDFLSINVFLISSWSLRDKTASFKRQNSFYSLIQRQYLVLSVLFKIVMSFFTCYNILRFIDMLIIHFESCLYSFLLKRMSIIILVLRIVQKCLKKLKILLLVCYFIFSFYNEYSIMIVVNKY